MKSLRNVEERDLRETAAWAPWAIVPVALGLFVGAIPVVNLVAITYQGTDYHCAVANFEGRPPNAASEAVESTGKFVGFPPVLECSFESEAASLNTAINVYEWHRPIGYVGMALVGLGVLLTAARRLLHQRIEGTA